jgi:hypothetical protein
MERMEQVPTGLKHILQTGKQKVNVSPQNEKKESSLPVGKNQEVMYSRDQSCNHYCS